MFTFYEQRIHEYNLAAFSDAFDRKEPQLPYSYLYMKLYNHWKKHPMIAREPAHFVGKSLKFDLEYIK